jgi:hypothetical protein
MTVSSDWVFNESEHSENESVRSKERFQPQPTVENEFSDARPETHPSSRLASSVVFDGSERVELSIGFISDD